MERERKLPRAIHSYESRYGRVDYGCILSNLLTSFGPSKIASWKQTNALEWSPLHDFRRNVELYRTTKKSLGLTYYKRVCMPPAPHYELDSGRIESEENYEDPNEQEFSMSQQHHLSQSIEYFHREHSDLYIPDELLYELFKEALVSENPSGRQRLLEGNLLCMKKAGKYRHMIYADTTPGNMELRISKMTHQTKDASSGKPIKSNRKTPTSLFKMSLPVRHICCSEKVDDEDEFDWYIGTYSYYETSFFKPSRDPRKGFEEVQRVSWEKQPSSLSFNPFYLSEALIGLEDGTGWIWNGYGDGKTTENLWLASEDSRAVKCDYMNHPRVILMMHNQGAFIRDARLHHQSASRSPIQLLAEQHDSTHGGPSHHQLYAMYIDPEDRMKFWLSSREAILLYDSRFLKQPLLPWNHHQEDHPPCGMQMLRLSESTKLMTTWNRKGENHAWAWSYQSSNRIPTALGAPFRFDSISDDSSRMIGSWCWFDSTSQELVLSRLFDSSSIYLDSYYVNYSNQAFPPSRRSLPTLTSCLDEYKFENHLCIDKTPELLATRNLIVEPREKELKRHQTINLRPLFDELKLKLYEGGHSLDVLDCDDFVNWLRDIPSTQVWSHRPFISTLDLLIDYNRQTDRPLTINKVHLDALKERILADEKVLEFLEPCDNLCDLGTLSSSSSIENHDDTSSNHDSRSTYIGIFRVKLFSGNNLPALQLPKQSTHIRHFDSLWRRGTRIENQIVDYEHPNLRHQTTSMVSDVPMDHAIPALERESLGLDQPSLSNLQSLSRLVHDPNLSQQDDSTVIPTILESTGFSSQPPSSSTTNLFTDSSKSVKKKARRSGF